MTKTPKPKKAKTTKTVENVNKNIIDIDDDCDCLACHLQRLIVDAVGEPSHDGDGETQINASETLSALIPTLGMLLTGLEYREVESYWLAVLSARSEAMLPDDVAFGADYKGRA